MIRFHLYSFIVFNFLLCFSSAYAQNQDIYCYNSYDEYRQIKYWGRICVSVGDYNYNSGDSEYLNLTYKNSKKRYLEETKKEIVAHFDKEFERLIKGNLPFHNTEEGRDERFAELYKKFGDSDNFIEILQAQEEARRNSLYGENPGAVYCIIKIDRRDFPVLYEMECNIIANKDLMNRGGLVEERKLGYSTPEHIVGELKNSISKLLEDLSDTLKRINNCK
jgi:hypothetical protein